MVTVLAVDVGSSSVRAQVFGERGEPVDELRQAAYGGNDPDEIVALVREVVAGRDETSMRSASRASGRACSRWTERDGR